MEDSSIVDLYWQRSEQRQTASMANIVILSLITFARMVKMRRNV